jgi:hypothetical protein
MQKIRELLPECQQPAIEMMHACFSIGKRYKISEAYRSETDHMKKYISGRKITEIPEDMKPIWQEHPTLEYAPIMTHAVHSSHCDRRAFDVKPFDCSFAEIHEIGMRFGIDWAIPGERWHFEIIPKKKSIFSFLHI